MSEEMFFRSQCYYVGEVIDTTKTLRYNMVAFDNAL
jgi:hypothetical protein